MAESLDKAALEYLVELGKKVNDLPLKEFSHEGRKYTYGRELKALETPIVTALSVSTLGSIVELCTGKFQSAKSETVAPPDAAFEGFDKALHLIHVLSPERVQVVSAFSNVWAKREVLIDCQLEETKKFPFESWLTQDKFIIAMLTHFQTSEDRDYVVKIAGNLTAENVSTAVDDGITQQVAQRGGAMLAAENRANVRNVLGLKLWRTFREVDQPTTNCLFRLQQSEAKQGQEKPVPMCAIFEADGGAWKIEARESIARFLRTGIPDATVVL